MYHQEQFYNCDFYFHVQLLWCLFSHEGEKHAQCPSAEMKKTVWGHSLMIFYWFATVLYMLLCVYVLHSYSVMFFAVAAHSVISHRHKMYFSAGWLIQVIWAKSLYSCHTLLVEKNGCYICHLHFLVAFLFLLTDGEILEQHYVTVGISKKSAAANPEVMWHFTTNVKKSVD